MSPLPEVDFGKDLGEVINFHFEDHRSLLNSVSSVILGTKVSGTLRQPALERAAARPRPNDSCRAEVADPDCQALSKRSRSQCCRD